MPERAAFPHHPAAAKCTNYPGITTHGTAGLYGRTQLGTKDGRLRPWRYSGRCRANDTCTAGASGTVKARGWQ